MIRRLLSDVLGSDPDLEVVGTAANGRIALSKIRQLNPDVVTLDVEMPEMDGLEALAEIRKDYPKLPVIMFSSLTERGASVTLDALATGANDYVTKPANVGSVVAATKSIRDELIPKIKVFCSEATGAKKSAREAADRPRAPVLRLAPQPHSGSILCRSRYQRVDRMHWKKLIPALPADFPVPVTIVQHMPPIFTKTLAQRLSATRQDSCS